MLAHTLGVDTFGGLKTLEGRNTHLFPNKVEGRDKDGVLDTSGVWTHLGLVGLKGLEYLGTWTHSAAWTSPRAWTDWLPGRTCRAEPLCGLDTVGGLNTWMPWSNSGALAKVAALRYLEA